MQENKTTVSIAELLAFTHKNKASDLHLTTGHEPMIRLHGQLRPIKHGALSQETVQQMLHSIMTDEQHKEYTDELELDFAISYGLNARFRVNAFHNTAGPAAVFRTIPTEIPSLADIRAPEIFKNLASKEKGLVLVTGPTGSGKSTTLAAMINYINETSAKHILTIEDPVEFVHKSKHSLINHREVGRNTHSFSRALKSALREDPDVILVGEMRDRETISLALTAAETGHLVMGTLHTSSAPQTINRIIDVFPAGDKPMVRSMLASSLQAVIAQILLPTIEGEGRVAAHEIMIANNAISNLIRENRIAQIKSMMQVGQRSGMQTMEMALEHLVRDNKIMPQHAASISTEPVMEQQGSEDKTPPTVTKKIAQKVRQTVAPPPPPAPPRHSLENKTEEKEPHPAAKAEQEPKAPQDEPPKKTGKAQSLL